MDDGSGLDSALWTEAGDSLLAEAIRLRRSIHEEPELGLHCPKTSAKIRKALKPHGIGVATGEVSELHRSMRLTN